MKERDYRSFSSIAQTRFKPVARALGYGQASGNLYVRAHPVGWYEAFALHTGWSGGDYFSVYCGVLTRQLVPWQAELSWQETGFILNRSLYNHNGAVGFLRRTRADISDSAQAVLQRYPQQAQPWLDGFQSWDDIAAEYRRIYTHEVAADRLGTAAEFKYNELKLSGYAHLLWRAGRHEEARFWLQQAADVLAQEKRLDDGQREYQLRITESLRQMGSCSPAPHKRFR